MGLISTLVSLTKAALKTKGNAPGQSAVAQAAGLAGQVLTPEIYQAPGLFALPGDGTKGIFLKVGGGGRYGVVVAVQNYQITIDVGGQGGTSIFSTTADGKTVKAKIVLKPDGTIEANGSTKRLVTFQELQDVLSAMNTAIKGHTHVVTGAADPSSHVVSGSASASPGLATMSADITTAKTTTLKTDG